MRFALGPVYTCFAGVAGILIFILVAVHSILDGTIKGLAVRPMVNYLDKDGRVAQLVEQCPFKAWVAGSNPAALTSSLLTAAGAGSKTFYEPV
jgi:hypothetical protein